MRYSAVFVGRGLLATVFALLIASGAVAFCVTGVQTAQAATDYLKAAQSMYGVADEDVYTVNSADEIASALSEAGSSATASKKCIVYLPDGKTYTLGGKITVPSNVVLVGEVGSKVTPSSKFDVLVQITGSVYGGTFDAKKKNLTVLKFSEVSFANKNGRIDKSVVLNSNKYGIVAIHSGCKNAVVSGVKVTGSYWSGISILDAAYVKTIEKSDFSKNGTKKEGAGINLSHANVGTIKNCTINNNADKAVSTNSDPVSGYKQPGCTITRITGCTMKGNGVNGVYIKPKCTLKHFTNNKLSGNNDGLSAVAVTVRGTKGAAVIKDVSGNTFKTSKTMQIKSVGKGAKIYLGSNNTIQSGKAAGIECRDKGRVYVKGSNNKISKQRGAGINVQSGGYFEMVKGKKNTITDNAHSSIYCVEKGVVKIKNAKLKGRIYCTSKGKVVLTKTKLDGPITGKGGNVVQK